ncbi:MAG: leucyl/phenylalanyl-tRNA--protein transferase [Rhodocyclaceae bacterium]|nr:leucyl/phenylalanyl-tRNA--protein transferase [Rhodocyclaceae bacterium]
MIPWLDTDDPFPAVHTALREPNGLLCAGADLSPNRLIQAYSHGIFPWFNEGEPILWWSPHPRMVLFPAELRISHSLAKTLARGLFEVRLDTAFARVMEECAAPRRSQAGTWISPAMMSAYGRLHELGYAHCVESWRDGSLVGGLYGVALGRVFFGESMFSRETDASKVALAHLVHHLEAAGFAMIDCQMATRHLASLGAREIPRTEFSRHLHDWTPAAARPARWPAHATKGIFAKGNQP